MGLMYQTCKEWTVAIEAYSNALQAKFHSPHKAYVGYVIQSRKQMTHSFIHSFIHSFTHSPCRTQLNHAFIIVELVGVMNVWMIPSQLKYTMVSNCVCSSFFRSFVRSHIFFPFFPSSIDRALAVDSCYSSAIEHKAAILCRQHQTKDAVELCHMAIKINPKQLSFAYRYLAAIQG
jgi:hypothetical protein